MYWPLLAEVLVWVLSVGSSEKIWRRLHPIPSILHSRINPIPPFPSNHHIPRPCSHTPNIRRLIRPPNLQGQGRHHHRRRSANSVGSALRWRALPTFLCENRRLYVQVGNVPDVGDEQGEQEN